MKKPISVLYADYYSFIGGGQQNLLSVFRGLDQRRVKAHLVLPKEGPFAVEARSLGVTVHIRSMGKARWRQPWSAYPAMLRLRRLMKEQGITLVHANDFPSFKLAAPAAKGLKLPVIYHQQIAVTQKPGSSTAWLMRRHLRRADLILAVSKNSLEALKALGLGTGKQVLRLLYNNADVESLAKAKPLSKKTLKAAGLGAKEKLVLAAGMRRPHKGFDVLLQAWGRLLGKHPREGFLLLMGDPANAEAGHEALLNGLQEALGPTPAFKSLPAQRPLAPWLKSAALFVSSSRWEGSPLVVLEAMAAGRPVLATQEAAGEILEHGRTGWLVPAEDPLALASALTVLLADAPLRRRLGVAAQKEARKRFSVRAYMKDLHGLYEGLTS